MSEKMVLIIGDKRFSSWSMRAWLVAKLCELPFDEVLVPLDQPETKKTLLMYSFSGQVPVLIDGDLRIWDSMSICEYLAEKSNRSGLWPEDSNSRALARTYVSEMHSGFSGMRSQLSMDLQLNVQVGHLTAQTIADIERVLFLWTSALKKSGGPFLFGEFGIVDAFYAPVVFRFLSYGINIESNLALEYMNNIRKNEHVKNWVDAGQKEATKAIVFKKL